MKATSLDSSRHLSGTAKPRLMEGVARQALQRQLNGLITGSLELVEGSDRRHFGASAERGLSARIDVLDPRFYPEVVFGGMIGAGEAYMHGYWRTDDLVGLTRLMLQNQHLMDGLDSGMARLTAPLQKLFHRINRNTRSGSRRNISAHYDLGNEFFGLWLDPTMMYSSAIFAKKDVSLHEAQTFRMEHICNKLQLGPQDHVIEIGTGWGGFALHAAGHHGCRVTTTTISNEQYEKSHQRIQQAGLQDRVTVLREDFRDLDGQYDKLVSLEMIEAVGHEHFDTYFKKCGDLLKPDGAMLIQAITIADQRYEAYRKSVDFIQRYIFPGGALPSLAVMAGSVARHTDLRLLDVEDIGLHYATTLNHWRRTFLARLEEVRGQGYPESFIRMWEFYLASCEGSFLERTISDVLVLFSKPASRLQTI
jgi:cyclopropane-fatty-acyl-phospholipid synthase